MAQSGIVNIEIVTDGPHHDFTRVQADPDLQANVLGLAEFPAIPPHFLLHRQGGITGPQGVVLVRQRRAKDRHDAIS